MVKEKLVVVTAVNWLLSTTILLFAPKRTFSFSVAPAAPRAARFPVDVEHNSLRARYLG